MSETAQTSSIALSLRFRPLAISVFYGVVEMLFCLSFKLGNACC